MKLYILYNNGIVKIGITKHEDVEKRISQINSNLIKDKKFKLICDFEVNHNPAMVERLIQDYLGINKLNIQYLKNELVLVNLEYLNSQQDGYTEFFLADKEKIKQAIILFGILGYININEDKINQLDIIKGYSLDYLTEKHSSFLKICQPILKNKNKVNLNNKNVADFTVEDNIYYLCLDEQKININELTNPDNKFISDLINNKTKLNIKRKSATELYAIIRKIRNENKETSLQPLVSMQKELKESEFNKFMNENEGYSKIRKVLDVWFDCGIFAEELIGQESRYYQYLNEVMGDKELDKKTKKYIQDAMTRLEKETKFLKPNFDSANIFPRYLSLIEKDNYTFEYYEPYNNMTQSIKIISSIFKIIYNSKDKENEIKKIDDFMDDIGTYHRRINDSSYPIKNAISFTKLEENIATTMSNNKQYVELAEATIKIFGDKLTPTKNESKTLNRINKLKG